MNVKVREACGARGPLPPLLGAPHDGLPPPVDSASVTWPMLALLLPAAALLPGLMTSKTMTGRSTR